MGTVLLFVAAEERSAHRNRPVQSLGICWTVQRRYHANAGIIYREHKVSTYIIAVSKYIEIATSFASQEDPPTLQLSEQASSLFAWVHPSGLSGICPRTGQRKAVALEIAREACCQRNGLAARISLSLEGFSREGCQEGSNRYLMGRGTRPSAFNMLPQAALSTPPSLSSGTYRYLYICTYELCNHLGKAFCAEVPEQV